MTRTIPILIGMIVAAALGVALIVAIPSMRHVDGVAAADAHADGVAYYTCSMHTSVRQSRPGNCPICKMELVPVLASDVSGGTITVAPGRRQLIGVKTGRVARHELTRELRTAATVVIDETRLLDVTVRVAGWLRTLAADSPGKLVAKGEVLFTLYSPELIGAQAEYLTARSADPGGALTTASRSRLARLGLDAAAISALERAGAPLDEVPIASPAAGVVIDKPIVAGSRVEPGMRALRLADLSRVWIEGAVQEQDLGLVAVGQQAAITLPMAGAGAGADALTGEVAFVYPYVDEAARTGRVRIALDNAAGALKPGMYATCAISVPLGSRLAVPADAVVYSGERRIVFRDLGDGRLKPVEVTVGERAQDLVEIRSGLDEGDAIVVSGVFLLASESRIASGTSQW